MLGKKSSNKSFRTWNCAFKSINKINFSCFVTTEIWYENVEITSKTDSDSYEIAVWIIILTFRQFHGYCNLFLRQFSAFSYLISVVTKHEKSILFTDLDAEFLQLLFEDILPKIIRETGNCESLILRVKLLCLK